MPPRAADPLAHPRSGARPLTRDREPADIPPARRPPPPVPADAGEDRAGDVAGEDQADDEAGEEEAGEEEGQGGGDGGGGRRIRPGSALAGAIVGLFIWPVAMAWITGGQDGARQWLRAKFFNEVPNNQPAAKTTAAA